jgi:hypothetical protein
MKVHRFRITMIENQSTNEWDREDEETVLASGADTLEEAYEEAAEELRDILKRQYDDKLNALLKKPKEDWEY